MLRFKKFIIESEEKARYHLGKLGDHPHAQFVTQFLQNNRDTRSKYLDFVANPAKADFHDPHELGSAIDYFHQAKNKENFPGGKDLNHSTSYPSHNDFMNKINRFKTSPLSKEEIGFSHPSANVIHNSRGIAVTALGDLPHDALRALRGRDATDKRLKNNSWCVSQNPDKYVPRSYSPDSFHIVHFRDPNNYGTHHFLYGKTSYGSSELKDIHDNPAHHDMNADLKSYLYKNKIKGLRELNGDKRFESHDDKEKRLADKSVFNLDAPWNSVHAEDIVDVVHDAEHRNLPYAKRLADKYPNVYNRDNLLGRKIANATSGLYGALARARDDPHPLSIQNRLMDLQGKNMDPMTQAHIIQDHPTNRDRLIRVFGDELSDHAQEAALTKEDPSAFKSVIDAMGHKMHPQVQKLAVSDHLDIKNREEKARALIAALGDHLHPDAREEAIKRGYLA